MTSPVLDALTTVVLTAPATALFMVLFRDEIADLFAGASQPKAGGRAPRLTIVKESENTEAGGGEYTRPRTDATARIDPASVGGRPRGVGSFARRDPQSVSIPTVVDGGRSDAYARPRREG